MGYYDYIEKEIEKISKIFQYIFKRMRELSKEEITKTDQIEIELYNRLNLDPEKIKEFNDNELRIYLEEKSITRKNIAAFASFYAELGDLLTEIDPESATRNFNLSLKIFNIYEKESATLSLAQINQIKKIKYWLKTNQGLCE